MAGGIFISYRREDSQNAAGRLFDRLTQSFGRERIFMDVDRIEPGLDFLKVINEKVAESFVFLVVIGRQWTNAAGRDGRRRLDDPDDLVRLEIEAGLKREIRVIPVLVDGAPMPSAAELPPSLQSLTRRQSVRINHDTFGTDADRLIATLSRVPAIADDSSLEPPERLEFSREQLLKLLEVVPADKKFVYKWPSIPPEKEKNARVAANVPAEEDIAALVDLTTWGSAKGALLFGKKALYYRDLMIRVPAGTLSYKQLNENPIRNKRWLTPFGWTIILGGFAFFWTVVLPVVAFFVFRGIGIAAGSILTIGPKSMFIRYDRSKHVFALLHALKVQIGRGGLVPA